MNATVLITRTPAKAASITEALTVQVPGARVRYAPVLDAVPHTSEEAEEAAFALIRGEFTWVTFTSVNGVVGFEALSTSLGQSVPALLGAAQVACVGRATEKALTDRGVMVDFVPETQSAAGMIDEWDLDPEWEDPTECSVLCIQGTTASPTLAQGLSDYGYTVATLEVYSMEEHPAQTLLNPAEQPPADGTGEPTLTAAGAREELGQVSVLVATSPLILTTLVEGYKTALPPIVAIGASTEAAARALPDTQRPEQILVAASPAPADLAAATASLLTS